MPNRIIREDLIDSERYAHLTDQAKLLFIHLMLVADDYGCVSLSATFLRRRCFFDQPTNERIAKLICELVDGDLIRTYEANHKVLAFIPRFGQRLQRFTLKHPPPPPSLTIDDLEATQKFNKLTINPTVDSRGSRLANGDSPCEEKRREEKLKRREVKSLAATSEEVLAGSVPTIPLNDKSEYPVSKEYLEELTKLYPDVEPLQTLREIRGWSLANPAKRKTKAGILRHINTWFARVQNA